MLEPETTMSEVGSPMLPGGEVEQIDHRQHLHDVLVSHLKSKIVPHQDDVKTRDLVVDAMAEDIIKELGKDDNLMQKVVGNEELLTKACDRHIGSAKMERFLKTHYNTKDDVKDLFS